MPAKAGPLPTRKWPSVLERWTSFGDWTKKPSLFGLSTGRTGTTTLEYALNLSPQMAAFHEPLPRDVQSYNHAYRDAYANPERVADYFRQHRERVILAFHRRGRVYAETNNFQFASPVISKILPSSVFLFFHRHPAEYVRSGMRRRWYNGHAWDYMRLVPREYDPWFGEWNQWGPFEKICWFWQAANQMFVDTIGELSSDRSMTVRFDDLVATKGEVLFPLFDRLGVSRPDRGRLNEVYSQPHNEQQSGDFPRYQEWTTEQRDTLQRIAGPMMNHLGYD